MRTGTVRRPASLWSVSLCRLSSAAILTILNGSHLAQPQKKRLTAPEARGLAISGAATLILCCGIPSSCPTVYLELIVSYPTSRA